MTHRTILFFISMTIVSLCALTGVPYADIADAEKLLDEGWADDAEALLDEMLESSPQNADLYYLLAQLYLYKDDSQEDYGGAPWSNLNRIEEYAKKATEIAPTNPGTL